ncbi:hypothetical protein D0812_27490 [Vibrio owensii]|uniref:Uncharacterized protein n=1 Tax=Vibrio owensii TaxID=696485 RepID=A0AAP9GC60_9VIBR|nr:MULTISPECIES: phage tail protein [Vibrio harveyi group]AYO18086.1 hypothetical protein D0812_27490 [Vibrio owensii]EHR5319969.1 phage tail protein [Vibrio parahaemolyticus]MBE3866071.1 hypothetical protein [Vibrio parahaemolyticus]MCR9655093.1 phage tail protein [Vibrio parahaemolyticus]QGH47270.1 hypothetical protein APZ19_09305 [Vibrio owensii]
MTVNAPKHAQWGIYGDVSFKGLFTPKEYNDSRKFSVQAQKLAHGYPSHQFFGEDERTFNLTLYVHNAFADLTKVTQAIEEMATNGIYRTLIIGTQIKGKFAIKAMSRRNELTLNEGQLIAFEQTLTLVEVRERNASNG